MVWEEVEEARASVWAWVVAAEGLGVPVYWVASGLSWELRGAATWGSVWRREAAQASGWIWEIGEGHCDEDCLILNLEKKSAVSKRIQDIVNIFIQV